VLGGVRLAVAETNRTGGLNGYKIVVRGLDDESDDNVAVDNIKTIQAALDKGEKVLGVIGHLNSGQTIAAMQQYSTMPSWSSPLPPRRYPSPSTITTTSSASTPTMMCRQYLTRFLTQKLNAHSVAVLYNDTPYGIGLAQGVKQRLTNQGLKWSPIYR